MGHKAVKPRIRKLKNGMWECKGRYANAVGVSPENSYELWDFVEFTLRNMIDKHLVHTTCA